MKLNYLIIFFVLLVVLAVYGYFKAVPINQTPLANRPQIIITPDSYNFGEIKYGQVVEYTFKVKNIGEQPLEISKVGASCSCTTAKVVKQSLPPNEETSLVVRYDSGAMGGFHGKGKQERIIYVRSNDPNHPQVEMMIFANVK